jgi:hypothetical protein
MADPRPQHITHRGPSLLKIPTPPYPGPGAALYGDRGPQRASNTGRRRALSSPPTSLEEHVQDAIARVPDLSSKQRLALRNTMMAMTATLSSLS